MSLNDWQKNGWLRPHTPSAAETQRLLDVVDRDLRAAGNKGMDDDWRFVAAYNAALQSANLALFASGFEAAKGGGAHHYTIESLKLTVGLEAETVDVLQAFRAKRGGAIYEQTGIATQTEIDELRELGADLRDRVRAWLTAEHPELLARTTKPKRK